MPSVQYFMTCLNKGGCDVQLCDPEYKWTSNGSEPNTPKCHDTKHIDQNVTVYMASTTNDGKPVMTDASVECQAAYLPNLKAMNKNSVNNIQGGCVTAALHLQLEHPDTVPATCVQGNCKWL